VCIYAQRNCDTILFHHEGGVDIGDVDSKVHMYIRLASFYSFLNTHKDSAKPVGNVVKTRGGTNVLIKMYD
jgi:succinyl-CoA synthetase beta subunit